MDCKRLINSMRYNNRVPPEDIAEAADTIETLMAERDAAIKILRETNWCAGCIHFRGLKGCANNAMSLCCEGDDHYQFFGQQKEEIRK